MISFVPKLHDLVGSTASRTVAQLHELGVEPSQHHVRLAVRIARGASPARWLLASALVDLLLRLDPLIGEVILDAADADEAALAAELNLKLPLEIRSEPGKPDYSISVGRGTGSSDLSIDASGWLVAMNEQSDADDDGNPIGPLAGAALATGEAFKLAFSAVYPHQARRLQLLPWEGVFSLFSYDFDHVSPRLEDICIAATLVGAGGVGGGVIRSIQALGNRISGSLSLVDLDVLTTDNLNRVWYASLAAALAGRAKVREAEEILRGSCPLLRVTGHEVTFEAYKQRTPKRENRKYDVAITGLDDDDIRWDVQRDLPRILIDGATGRDMVARVERVEFGRYGCLGCSRPRRAVPAAPGNCATPPDVHAPSLSFVSVYPGILAAGELIKEAMGAGRLRGRFDHVFRYGPNPDLASMPALAKDCVVDCGRPSKLAQYKRKYPAERIS